MAGSFDVFFSYASRDHAAVGRVARELTARGLSVFLDRWYLTPGQSWQQELRRHLDECAAVCVFVGAEGLGRWQINECELALDRKTREQDFPVIPVLLSRADPGLGFLGLTTWVDLTAGADEETALAILAKAIRREPPGPDADQHSREVRAAVCPYRGLQPFREEDEPFFFGRTAFSETLTESVIDQSFVAVVGASGSGKSSVVRAGLIPRLRRGAGNRTWDAVTLVPTDRPLTSLAAALLPGLEPELSEVDRLAEIKKLAGHFRDGTVPLRDVAERVLEKQPGTDRLLIFVDQWEELYTLTTDEDARGAFIDQLLDAAGAGAFHVVFTIRGDFMGKALDNRALADRMQNGVVTVGPLTRAELHESIVKPAEKAALGFEDGLPETILDDLGNEPGGLPLLEFLLEGLWKERRGNLLTYDAYTRLGKVSGAIAHRAEEVFENSLTEAERQAAQKLLMQMVRPGEGVEDTRRRAALPADDAIADAAIRKLAGERLVVTERDAGSGAVSMEVAHEALIRRWKRLRHWIDTDREFLRTRDRIAAQAQLWETEGRPSDDRLLPAGRALAEGEDLLATRRDDLEPLLIDYIETSSEAARTAERKRRSRNRAFSAAMAVIALIAVLAGGVAWWQKGVANRNAEIAEMSAETARQNEERAKQSAELARKNEERAQRNSSRALAALAISEAQNGSPATAARVALAAVPRHLTATHRAYARQAEGAVHHSLALLQEEKDRFAHERGVASVAFSPDGKTLATGSDDSTARLWNVTTGQPITTLQGHENGVFSVAFSPDGKTLATGSDDSTARLWNVATGQPITTLKGHENSVWSVAFGPDGKTLATGSADNTARLWNVATGQPITTLRGHENWVGSVAFSPDGKTLATGSDDNTARLWNVATGQPITTLQGHENRVWSVAFSPDGQTFATGSQDNTARLWPIEQRLIDLACARVHYLPLSDYDKERFGIEEEWCTPEVSGALRKKLGLDEPELPPASVTTAAD